MNSYGEKYTNGLPGRDWDVLSLEFNREIIAEMEQDVIDIVRYLKNHSEKMLDSWLFKYGGFTPLTDEDMEVWQAFQRKMREADSWILNVAGLFVRAFTKNFLSLMKAGFANEETPAEITVYGELIEEDIRKAETLKENEWLLALMECLPSLLQSSFEGLEEFLSDEVAEVLDSSCYGVSLQRPADDADTVEVMKIVREKARVGLGEAKKIVDKAIEDGFAIIATNLSYVDAEIVRENFDDTDVKVLLRVCNTEKALRVLGGAHEVVLDESKQQKTSVKVEPKRIKESFTLTAEAEKSVSGVLQAFTKNEAKVRPDEINYIQLGMAEDIFPEKIKNVSLDVNKFVNEKKNFSRNEEQEKQTHKKLVAEHEELQLQKEGERARKAEAKEARKQKWGKVFKVVAIIVAIVVIIGVLLPLLAGFSTEICTGIAMVLALVVALVWKFKNDGSFIVSYIVSYILIAILLIGASYGAKALLIRDVKDLYTPEIVKVYEVDSDDGVKLSITECTDEGYITAYWTWNAENGNYGRVKLSGHISEKKSDGSITIHWDSQTVETISQNTSWDDESWLKITDNYTKIITDTDVEFHATD